MSKLSEERRLSRRTIKEKYVLSEEDELLMLLLDEDVEDIESDFEVQLIKKFYNSKRGDK